MPPPMSMTATPISFSSSLRTASALASGWSTTSATVRPQRSAQRMTFCTQLVAAVTRFTFTPRRTPPIPMGSRMPSWLSTMYSRGRTWRICRSASTGMARAPSSTRSTSPRVTSPPAMAATPSRARRADVAAADAGVDGADLDARHRLRALDGVLDRAHRPVDVGDDPLAEPAAGHHADARGW